MKNILQPVYFLHHRSLTYFLCQKFIITYKFPAYVLNWKLRVPDTFHTYNNFFWTWESTSQQRNNICIAYISLPLLAFLFDIFIAYSKFITYFWCVRYLWDIYGKSDIYNIYKRFIYFSNLCEWFMYGKFIIHDIWLFIFLVR